MLHMLRVSTDMQFHMFSLITRCPVSICENLKKRYTIRLLFIITEAQMPLLFETSDPPFLLRTNQHNFHSVCRICLYSSKCGSRISLFLSRSSFSIQCSCTDTYFKINMLCLF
jgi:hypothetical protein